MLEEVHHRGKLLEYIILPYFRILSLSFMAALGDDSFLHVPSYKTVSSNPNAKFAPAEHSLESSSNALPRWNQYISLSLFSFPLPFFFQSSGFARCLSTHQKKSLHYFFIGKLPHLLLLYMSRTCRGAFLMKISFAFQNYQRHRTFSHLRMALYFYDSAVNVVFSSYFKCLSL